MRLMTDKMMRVPPGLVAFLTLSAVVARDLHLPKAQQQPSEQESQQQLTASLQNDRDMGNTLTVRPVVDTYKNHRDQVVNMRDSDIIHHEILTMLSLQDVSAFHASAPDDESVRAPSLRPTSSALGGLSPPLVARNLGDWEAEDFVLLATVDGGLYASNRKTGAIRWHLQNEKPMIETKHYRTNQSRLDEVYDPVDYYIWVVAPTTDGELYLWNPGESYTGLVKMPYTMKQMVEDLAPYEDKEQHITYTGEKKTTLITLDASTGRILKWFDSTGVQNNEMKNCLKPTVPAGIDAEKCSNKGTITLGRTEYTVSIHRTDKNGRPGPARPVATLKYSEWGPNTFDNDLLHQHMGTKNNHFITSRHDGWVVEVDCSRVTTERPVGFTQKLDSPVARVFDVLRRVNDPSSNLDLTVLPQPLPPAEEERIRRLRNTDVLDSVFINQTVTGGWYALSGARYPLVLNAPIAKIHAGDAWMLRQSWDLMDEDRMSKALIGIHPLLFSAGLSSSWESAQVSYPSLPDKPANSPKARGRDAEFATVSIPQPESSRVIEATKKWSEVALYFAVGKVLELICNPVTIAGLGALLWFYRREILRRVKQTSQPWIKRHFTGLLDSADFDDLGSSDEKEAEEVAAQVEMVINSEPDETGANLQDRSATASLNAKHMNAPTQPLEMATIIDPGPTVTFAEPSELQQLKDINVTDKTEKSKRTHRGRRGGVKHKKIKNKLEISDSRDDLLQKDTDKVIKEVVQRAGAQPRLEPDIQTVSANVDDMSAPTIKIGSLEVDEDQQLGKGSNGTIVFAGKWDGRDVAVKRMLIQFNEIADQETRLLRESDDHPNVIRYYAQQQRTPFLYIALELCVASLADVVQKPHVFGNLALAVERDQPLLCYQIANGLGYLHSLRIVHRDLKPQNILVKLGRNGRPRLLVSDFGLCKKLERGQSSLGATTTLAAGTSGWRAPELLIDDDASSGFTVAEQASANSGSHPGSAIPGPEMYGVNNRRVTRAIDIFALGLVFYFVLTKGNHPFDQDGRYMLEVNIRKGNYDLSALELLGNNCAGEAESLIRWMLSPNPKARPNAEQIMSHPFFWTLERRLSFLCDVSDHFERECRDPPSPALELLESHAGRVIPYSDFLRLLPKDFVDSLGKQRKYTGSRILDLLRALRNKRNHYEDMSETLRNKVGLIPEGYLLFWTRRFPQLLMACWEVLGVLGWDQEGRFKEYSKPAAL